MGAEGQGRRDGGRQGRRECGRQGGRESVKLGWVGCRENKRAGRAVGGWLLVGAACSLLE